MEDVAGIASPVEGEIRTLAETLDECAMPSSSVGDHLDVVHAGEALRDLAADAPSSVRAVVPTLERVLRESAGSDGDATASDLYVAGLRERHRELIAATLASIADSSLVRGYEASSYSLSTLVATVGRTLTATSADVVRKHCLRTLAAIGRTRPDAVRAVLDADAVVVGVNWLQKRETSEEWQEAVVAELLAVTVPVFPSVWEDAPVAAVTERLLVSESATTRAFAQAVSRRAPAGLELDASDDQLFVPLRRLREDASLTDRERRQVAHAVGRCVALDPVLVADAPAALVERVQSAPKQVAAATALGEVVANSVRSDGRTGAALVDRVEAASGETRDRHVRLLGEVAVCYPEWFSSSPLEFCERVAALTLPDAAAVRAVGECVIAGAEDDHPLAALRRQIRTGTGQERERAAVALGEWVAHVPAVVDTAVASQAAAVRAASDDERETAAAVLGMYVVVVESRGVESAATVCGSDESTRAARVRGERVLTGEIDDVDLWREIRAGLRGSRGITRRFVTHALGVAHRYQEATGGPPLAALRAAVVSSALDERQNRLRLLGEWVAATGASEEQFPALARRVRETTGTDRERAAHAIGLAMTSGVGSDTWYGAATDVVVARLAVHDETVEAIRRAVRRAHQDPTDVSTKGLPAGVPAVDRDWSLRALGEAAAVTGDALPPGCRSLAATVDESAGWDRQSAARALGAALVFESHQTVGVLEWVTGNLGETSGSRGALTYTLGEVVAAHPQLLPDVPDALVASVREASGPVRTMKARALGEYVRIPALAEPSGVEVLQAAASDPRGDARAPLMRALGEIIVALPDPGVEVPGLLVDTAANATGQDRRALARLLGELAVTDDPGNILDRVAPTESDASVFERARRSRMTQGLAAIETVGVEDFLAAVSIGTTAAVDIASFTDLDAPPVEVLLESPPPIRDPLLDALTTLLEDRTTTVLGDLDMRLDAWLRDSSDAEATARLHAVAARSAIDTTAVSTNR
ncbi:hypothetical protein [Haloarchaeobius sp. DYHT-AS-18]|uniref:hypothetical protein n=1 Tax=Haloarchaeobius sp. DYHT-AS-18 TaxID=3446117 RepID=UPI003EBE72C5